jgi:hypothetical protein
MNQKSTELWRTEGQEISFREEDFQKKIEPRSTMYEQLGMSRKLVMKSRRHYR